MNVCREIVTTKKAMEWLKRNAANRPMSPATVNHYALAMTEGQWKLNGDCIRFNGDGGLIDGQHRLTACVQAGKPFETYVIRGLTHESFDTIDQGRKRTIADVFARAGVVHYTTVAASIRWLSMYVAAGSLSGKNSAIRPDQANELLANHPGIHLAADKARGMCRQKLISPGLLAFLIYCTDTINKDLSEKFWPSVVEGVNIKKNSWSHTLHKRLVGNLGNVAKLPTVDIAALCIKAWNYDIEGRTPGNLKFSADESFPRFKDLNF